MRDNRRLPWLDRSRHGDEADPHHLGLGLASGWSGRPRSASPLVAGLVAVVMLASGCGRATDDTRAARTGNDLILQAAVDRTLTVGMLRVERSRVGVGESDGGTMVSEFQPPDRARSVTSGDHSREIVLTGTAVYLSVPGREGFYSTSASPDVRTLALSNVLLPLQVLNGARDVTEVDGWLRVEGVSGTAEAELSNGYVTSVRLRWEKGLGRLDADYDLTGFVDDAERPLIEGPPTDRVVQVTPNEPGCVAVSEKDLGLPLCFNPVPHQPLPARLPAPDGSTESTLQLRPIRSVVPLLSEASDLCAETGANPGPAASVRVPGKSKCYDLGPAGLQVTQAGRVEAMSRQGDPADLSTYFTEDPGVDLHLTFTAEDAIRIGGLAAEHPGGLAVVMFGRVLTVEELDATEGRFVLRALAPGLASRITTALSDRPTGL